METHLLDLWHDLEEFLPVVLVCNRENSFFLHHLIGEKICNTCLEDNNIEKLPLESRALVLCGLYEEFLASDDKTFLQFMMLRRSDHERSSICDDERDGETVRFEEEDEEEEEEKKNGENLSLTSHHHDLEPCYAVASLSNNVVYANLPVKEKKSRSPAKSPHSHKGKGKGQLQKVRPHFGQFIVVTFLVDNLHFYLEMDKLADCEEAAAPCNMRSEKHVSFLKRKLGIISKLFLNSDIPPKLWVNISEKGRDLICRSSSKGPLTRAVYHNAKVTLFPILMFFWRRFCTWKVMRSFGAYRGQEIRSSGIHQELSAHQGGLELLVPTGGEELLGPQGGQGSSLFTPSKTRKIPGPKKLVPIPSTTHYTLDLFFQCRNTQT
ncbi:Regulator of G-protein signaling protein-like [Lonchura striata]|uniref:Regulator of G-protein signaling protein-like n=1 Tax=Lonchura striata TaxID=40157 RepID=A0A218V5P6_9PASE|nr:Regulator of G-protein signaling protein-like [Lonchura striata domestica]